MLVLFGANGRTGLAILREAERRGIPTRAVVRDDRDIDRIKGIADVQKLSYADPRHIDAVRAVMTDATWVISAIDPRGSGPGAPIYPREAAANIAWACTEAGVSGLIHVSVMGSFRWSPLEANTLSFELDTGIRDAEAPWLILRFSCYFDEVLEGHVRPPDGAAPHPVPRHSRYSPISRRDAAKMTLDMLPRFSPGRAVCAGGPQTFFSDELVALISPYKAKGRRPRTRYLSLPPGDVSVDAGTTRATAGYIPRDSLAQALAGEDTDLAEPAQRATVYPVGDPPPHPADSGRGGPALAKASADLRRVIHKQLVEDLARIGVTEDSVTLDFRGAVGGRRHVKAHGGEVPEMSGVRVLSAEGAELFVGDVDLLRDKLAEEFRCWWKGEGIPDAVWRELDMGVRRRLAADPHFKGDAQVRVFLAQNVG